MLQRIWSEIGQTGIAFGWQPSLAEINLNTPKSDIKIVKLTLQLAKMLASNPSFTGKASKAVKIMPGNFARDQKIMAGNFAIDLSKLWSNSTKLKKSKTHYCQLCPSLRDNLCWMFIWDFWALLAAILSSWLTLNFKLLTYEW